MEEEIKNLKPFILNLRRSLRDLKPALNDVTKVSLNDSLIQLTSEQERLKLTNTFAYVLNSLMFAYMKLINVKDLSQIMTELNKCKEYIKKANEIDHKLKKIDNSKELKNEKNKQTIINALNNNIDKSNKHSDFNTKPSISNENFQKGKHIKFENDEERKIVNEKLKDNIIKNSKNKKNKIAKK